MKIFGFLIALMAFVSSFAQDKFEKIDSIADGYNNHLAKAKAEQMDAYIPKIEIKSLLIKRAIGEVGHSISIYFDRKDEMVEDENGMEETYKAIIRKVAFTVETSAYTIDYAYSFDEKGNLIRYTETMIGNECFKRILYYENDKCLKIKQIIIDEEFCDNSDIKAFEIDNLSMDDKSNISHIIEEADRFKKILVLNYALMMAE